MSRLVPARLLKTSVVLLVGSVLGACAGGFEDTLDNISDMNPLRTKEKILPGERTPIVADEALIETEIANASASIGGSSGGEWAQPGGNAANDAGHRSFASPPNLTFRAALGGGDKKMRIAARPVSAGGRIYVYRPNGSVVAMGTNGGRVWERSLRPERERQLASGGGVTTDGQAVYVGTGYRKFAALSAANGSELWAIDLPAPARGAPTVAGDTVYIVTQDNEVLALNTADGTERWSNQGIPESAGVLGASNPAIAGGKVVVPYSSGEVIAFDADSGEISWVDTLTTGNRIMAISGLSDISGSPVVADGVVFTSGVSGRTIANNLRDGKRVWEQSIGSPFTPIVSGNAVFMVDINNGMTALDRKTGEPLWRTQLPKAKKAKDRLHWVGPVLAGNALYAFSADGSLAHVDPSSGSIVSVASVGDGIGVQPVVSGGQMIMISTRDTVLGFN